jgi:hypothetical protein
VLERTGIPTAPPSGGAALVLPSTGPDPLPFDTAVAALLGYARGRHPMRVRTPDAPRGRWISMPAYGWERFDARAPEPPGDTDVLIGELLHGRLDRTGWTAVRAALDLTRPLATTAAAIADGRAIWELPDDELSVLGEPGTVGAALREISRATGAHTGHVTAALNHRHPALVPHISRSTRVALLPHVEEGDSGLAAVVHRELRDNAAALDALERTVSELTGNAAPTRLRLHDILLWLATTLRLTHAIELGRGTAEWQQYRGR